VRDLAALHQLVLHALGLDQPRVLGLGFGGWLAAELATLCPGRFRRMALVAPVGVKPATGEIYDQFLVQAPAYVRRGFHDPAKFEATFGNEPDLDRREQWEINREMAARVAWAPYMFRNSLPRLLPYVSTPTLVVWGEDDRVIPAATAQQWQELLPNAQLRLIGECGHFPDVEQPEALAQAVASFMAMA
jgi:pimeloyl-ACP methyl ester carboxylesterase